MANASNSYVAIPYWTCYFFSVIFRYFLLLLSFLPKVDTAKLNTGKIDAARIDRTKTAPEWIDTTKLTLTKTETATNGGTDKIPLGHNPSQTTSPLPPAENSKVDRIYPIPILSQITIIITIYFYWGNTYQMIKSKLGIPWHLLKLNIQSNVWPTHTQDNNF